MRALPSEVVTRLLNLLPSDDMNSQRELSGLRNSKTTLVLLLRLLLLAGVLLESSEASAGTGSFAA